MTDTFLGLFALVFVHWISSVSCRIPGSRLWLGRLPEAVRGRSSSTAVFPNSKSFIYSCQDFNLLISWAVSESLTRMRCTVTEYNIDVSMKPGACPAVLRHKWIKNVNFCLQAGWQDCCLVISDVSSSYGGGLVNLDLKSAVKVYTQINAIDTWWKRIHLPCWWNLWWTYGVVACWSAMSLVYSHHVVHRYMLLSHDRPLQCSFSFEKQIDEMPVLLPSVRCVNSD